MGCNFFFFFGRNESETIKYGIKKKGEKRRRNGFRVPK